MQVYVLYMDDGFNAEPQEVYRGPLSHAKVGALIPGAVYTFSVAAVNYNGEGDVSPAVTLTSCVSPSQVAAPRLVTTTESSATIRWSPPGDDGGCPISGYKIYRDDGAEGALTTPVTFEAPAAVVQDTAEPYQFEHVVELGSSFSGLNVRFTLEAINSEGSGFSPGYLTALIATVPSAPTAGPTRLASSKDSLTVQLPEVTANGGLILDAY